jgi:sterol desaturase/sphingolipid hydroxylase (fatty acid hydroxylase superfamily)
MGCSARKGFLPWEGFVSLGLAPALTDYRPIAGSLEAYERGQSRIARRQLYPLTIFYTIYSLIVTLLMLRSRHPLLGIMFYLAGIPVWSLVEYLFHRYAHPGRFLHGRLDPLNRERHHESPFDGGHFSEELKDFLPLFFVAAPFSFLFPAYTLPVLLAGVVESYVGEAWTHYFVHFGKFHKRFFRLLKRYHLYHHSPRGTENGCGIANGILGCLFHTQYPRPLRRPLSKSGGHTIRVKKMTRSEALRLFRERFKQQ